MPDTLVARPIVPESGRSGHIVDPKSTCFLSLLNNNGKPSKIQSLCNHAINTRYTECVWLCYSHNEKYFARDIKIHPEGTPLEISSLRKRCGWWKRISLRSAVGVRLVKVFGRHKKILHNEMLTLNRRCISWKIRVTAT